MRERSRILAPCVIAALVFFLSAAGPLGIQPPLAWHLASWSPAIVGAVLTVAMRTVGDRWIHLASAGTLWCPMVSTCLAFYATRDPIFVLLLITAIASAGVLLHTPYTIATLIGAVSVGTWLLIRSDVAQLAMHVAAIVTAAMFAIVIHVLMRRALIRIELMRRTEVEHHARFAAQIAERERAEAERASLAEQLLHAQRMEAVGTLAAGLAHDMNNVLASISGFAALAHEQVDRPAVKADIEQIITQAGRGAELTRGLLAFSRRGQYRKQVVRSVAVVEDVLPLLRRTLPKSIEIESELALGETYVEADPVHLQQVLINLGLNAADAMGGSGSLAIRGDVVGVAAGAVATLAAGRYVRLAVSDTGKGIDAATKLRMFEPFFTTKPQGSGTGLGLAIVWGIIQAHGGAIEVDSEPGAGATFRIYLPITERARTVRKPSLSVAPRNRETTVLVIDDEPTVRTSTKRLLERLGMQVLVAENGKEGLEVFTRAAGSIELVILDMGMPVMGGAECFRRIREHSQVPILIATGYADDVEAQELVAAGATILEKPYTPSALRTEVARLVAGATDPD